MRAHAAWLISTEKVSLAESEVMALICRADGSLLDVPRLSRRASGEVAVGGVQCLPSGGCQESTSCTWFPHCFFHNLLRLHRPPRHFPAFLIASRASASWPGNTGISIAELATPPQFAAATRWCERHAGAEVRGLGRGRSHRPAVEVGDDRRSSDQSELATAGILLERRHPKKAAKITKNKRAARPNSF